MSGSCSCTAATAVSGLNSKSASRGAAIHSVPVPDASSAVHGVGRREAEHRATGPAVGLHDVLQHLVGPVRGPELLGRQPMTEVAGESRSEFGELAVGVAIESQDGRGDAGDDVVRHVFGDGMRVLVDVERDRNLRLRSAIGRTPTKVVADGEVVETRHRSMLPTTTRAGVSRDVSRRSALRGAVPARSPHRRGR